MLTSRSHAVWIAALAAALYAVSTPFAKLLLKSVDPVMIVGAFLTARD